MGNKQDKCVAAGATSTIAATGGLIAMVAAGPIGIIIGGAILSAGVSGTLNSVSQHNNDKEDFSFG